MLTPIDPNQFIPTSILAPPEGGEPIEGNMPPEDLALICRMVAHLRPSTAFEFGTFRGATTHNIAKYSPPDAIVYTLDLPPSSTQATFQLHGGEMRYANKLEVGAVYRRFTDSRKVVQLIGDSALFDFSRFAKLIDFILIDASHTYENCLSDSLRALTMRSSRGVIAWHDYGVWEGVTAALDDLQRAAAPFASLRHVAGTGVAVLL